MFTWLKLNWPRSQTEKAHSKSALSRHLFSWITMLLSLKWLYFIAFIYKCYDFLTSAILEWVLPSNEHRNRNTKNLKSAVALNWVNASKNYPIFILDKCPDLHVYNKNNVTSTKHLMIVHKCLDMTWFQLPMLLFLSLQQPGFVAYECSHLSLL